VTLHTTRDPLVPVWHEDLYRAAVDRSGRSAMLSQRRVDRYGHCELTLEEQSEAFDALVGWSQTGVAAH